MLMSLAARSFRCSYSDYSVTLLTQPALVQQSQVALCVCGIADSTLLEMSRSVRSNSSNLYIEYLESPGRRTNHRHQQVF
jgi:hypothetical protein